MKVENKEVSIKIGNKEKTFKNLILDSYLDLFADSFLSFKNKDLPYCLVNFTHENNINEQSTSMNYDTILEADFSNNIEILNENFVINKYYYKNAVAEEKELNEFKGYQIKDIGFANYDYQANKYVLYAYLDVSKYNIIIQDSQEVIISRVDKIESDMSLFASNKNIKAPTHLTMRGILKITGMEYETIMPKLYSVGFGAYFQKINKEYLVSDLNIQKTGVGKIQINTSLENYLEEGLYPSKSLYPSETLYPKKGRYQYLIYKFKH